ncbi:hypothetical protein [Pseudonocardia sp. MH-G8]|uniref:hypothetical protein n=1 Tax=Pseudonocardia sp. MH-G8 TaxID=1854588 RepID=UPI001179CE80|nr:hypothetical protein [Pseudonocardia sp. MH-G8]
MSPVTFMTAVAPAVLGVGVVSIAGIGSMVFLAVVPLVTVVVLVACRPAVVLTMRVLTTARTTIVLGPVLGVAVLRPALVVTVGRGSRLPWPVEDVGFLAALVVPVAQFGNGSVELHIHSSRLDHGDAGPRGRDQRPDPIDNGGEFGAGRAGNGHDVGVGRSIGGGPSTPGDRGLERESSGGAAGHSDDKHMRASLRNPEQPRRHVHRRAPSRHA